jgi:1,4-dihydroxy-2-naphthoate octaprenyltransferase
MSVNDEFITVSRRDPKFQDYLSGNFSKTQRALSIQSLNVNTESEQVTFQLVPVRQIQRPGFFSRWAQILKLHNFYLVAFPIFAVLMKSMADETLFDLPTALCSSLACLFLMAAVNLRNDFLDYSSGLDRVHPHSGSRAIQLGWITAARVERLSNFCLGFGLLLGLPAIFFNHQELYLVGALALLAAIGFTSYKMGLKYRRWSELTVFLLLGPLLTTGIQLSTGAGLDAESVMIGIVTGWYAVFYLHLKNFEQLMVNEQAEFKNTMTSLGFEKGKWLLFGWWVILLALLGVSHFYFSAVLWSLVMMFAAVISVVIFYSHVKALRSPVGSGMTSMIEVARKMGLAIMGLWALEFFWYLWILR